MQFEPASLEEWMREFYFETDIDIGSSGVADFSVARLRSLVGITIDDLDRVVLRDSTSWGSMPLRRAIAARWGDGDPDRVMVTHGASEAIYLMLHTVLNPGDEVVALDPIYHSLSSVARTIGCRLRRWPLRADRGFAVDIADAARLITPRTRMVIVNFPHNPTGVTVTARQQADLVDLVAEVGAVLLWDTAFGDLVHDGPPLPDPTTLHRDAISVGTLSKAYGTPGLRFGWCLADPGLLARAVHLRDRVTLHLSPLVEFFAQRVIEQGDQILAEVLPTVAAGRSAVLAWAGEHRDLIDLPPPQGGVTAFARITGHADTEPLCRLLATAHRTLLVPGRCFGHPDRVRLGFGGTAGELSAGLAVLAGATRQWRHETGLEGSSRAQCLPDRA